MHVYEVSRSMVLPECVCTHSHDWVAQGLRQPHAKHFIPYSLPKLQTILPGTWHVYFHFPDEKTGLNGFKHLPKVSQDEVT